MAKQSINPIEQHVEKIVVGVVALLFLWVAFGYVLSSPNKISLNNATVTPADVDLEVRKKAERVLQQIANAQVKPSEVLDYPGELQRLSPGPLYQEGLDIASTLRASVPYGPSVPVVVGIGAQGRVTLATLAAPDKPELAIGRLTHIFPPNSVAIGTSLSDYEMQRMTLEGPQERSWVTVLARMETAKQKAVLLRNDYETSRLTITIADVFLQRQRRLDNGEWSPWEEVDEYSEFHMDPAPKLTLTPDDDGHFSIPARQRENLQIWYANLVEFQVDLVRPPLPAYPEFGEEWRPPQLRKLIALYPEEIFPLPLDPVSTAKKKLSPRKLAEWNLTEARKLFDQGDWDAALELVQKVTSDNRISRRNALRTRAEDLTEQILKKIKERELQGLKPSDGDDNGDDDEEVELAEELFFAHDLSAEPGAIYRYRTKLQAFNHYATIVERLKIPEDATKVYIESEWSQPSEPVMVPAQQRMYLASAKVDKNKRTARIEAYKWVLGAWEKHQLNVKVGEVVVGSKKNVQRDNRMTVEFDMGVVLIDIIPEKTYLPRKRQRDGSFTLGELEESVAAVCQDDSGEVFTLVRLAGTHDAERRLLDQAIDEYRKSKKKGR